MSHLGGRTYNMIEVSDIIQFPNEVLKFTSHTQTVYIMRRHNILNDDIKRQ